MRIKVTADRDLAVVVADVRHREKTRERNQLTDTSVCVTLCVEVDNGDKSST